MLPVCYSLARRGPPRSCATVEKGRGERGEGLEKEKMSGRRTRADEETAARIKRNKKNSIVKFKVCGLSFGIFRLRVVPLASCAIERLSDKFPLDSVTQS
jgi:hypothetical protein